MTEAVQLVVDNTEEKRSNYSSETVKQLKKKFALIPDVSGRSQLVLLSDRDLMPQDNELLLRAAASFEGENLHWNWGDQYNLRVSRLRSKLPYCAKKVYLPESPRVFVPAELNGIDNVYHLNLYAKPNVQFSGVIRPECPKIFAEYLERMFPVEWEREYMIQWLARTICKPKYRVGVAAVIRGEPGTGKGVFIDTVLKDLSGLSNYAKSTLTKTIGRFNKALGESTVYVLDETYSDKKQAADGLKNLITDEFLEIEEKYGNPRIQSVYANFVITSNIENPIYIEKGVDRRYFVPQFICHKVDKVETKDFVNQTLIPWWSLTGQQEVRDWLQGIDNECAEDFKVAPDSESKQRIAYSDPKADALVELGDKLDEESHVLINDLAEEFKKLNRPEITEMLRKYGFEEPKNAKTINGRRARWWVKDDLHVSELPAHDSTLDNCGNW